MATLNLYIRSSDEAAFEQFKEILEREKLSMAEVIAEMVQDYVVAKTTELKEIELQAQGVKRIFRGHRLYWSDDGVEETGVFLTARGKIAYWWYHDGTGDEEFQVYEDLDELWAKKNIEPRMRIAIQREYVAVTNKPLVERLDI
jgi:hypothetical protein